LIWAANTTALTISDKTILSNSTAYRLTYFCAGLAP
jgi:hypothetical protein